MRIKVIFYSGNQLTVSFNYNMDIQIQLIKVVSDYFASGMKGKKLYLADVEADFTFSQLMFPKRTFNKGAIIVEPGYFYLYISSISGEFIEVLKNGLEMANLFSIKDNSFKVASVKYVPEPEFKGEMKFKMLSPSLFAIRKRGGVIFLKPGDEGFEEVFVNKLKGKWSEAYGESTNEILEMELDKEYIERSSVTKLLKIDGINYRAVMAPFTLKGSIELIKFAYRNGIGDKNRFGLGMIDLI